MAQLGPADFLSGVVEGFYGRPWSQAERFELFDWMAAWGLNTYLYAPKDDLKHRASWREPYSPTEAVELVSLIQACRQRSLRFIYALSPGLDIRYSDESDLDYLRGRFQQVLSLGCQHFSLLFDDIPDRVDSETLGCWGSLASAQCHVANTIFRWTRERCPEARFLFCPTPYCGRMVARKLGGEGYLSIVGRELAPGIDVFWTGPEIISREITAAHAQELGRVLCRKPLIWDNLHANDYDGRRFYCGPYAGRTPALRGAVSGVLSNPNCEFPLNYVPLRTLAEFVRCEGNWDARLAYLAAMKEWLPHFATAGQLVTLEDLILFGDCYYLPHEEGPEAEALYQLARSLVNGDAADGSAAAMVGRVIPGAPGDRVSEAGAHGVTRPTSGSCRVEWCDQAADFRRNAARLREFCVRMTELRERPLFHALSRRVWDLREELDLLERFVEFQSENATSSGDASFHSDSHLPGTYRGGMIARLERLLVQRADGAVQTNGHPVDPFHSHSGKANPEA